ncbi:MAG: hypothetical protein LBR20_05065 [Propionibacteriaceae bacterium]|nr:hypothetical protein [Propionibacteriaceae bacterium]
MDSRRLRFVVATLVSVSLLGGLLATVPQFSSAASSTVGNRVWVKAYGGAGAEEFRSIAKLSDGNLVAAGVSTSDSIGGTGAYDAFVNKLNLGGLSLWSKSVGGAYQDYFYGVAASADGGFAAVGGSEPPSSDFAVPNGHGRDAAIMKFDQNGNKLKATTLGGTGDDFFNAVAATSDGGFIAAGFTGSKDGDIKDKIDETNVHALLAKFDSNGDKLYLVTIGGTGTDSITGVSATSDGGFYVAGFTTSIDGDIVTNTTSLPRGGQDGFIMRLDQWANIIWSANVGGTGADKLLGVTTTADGGVLAVGQTYSVNGDGAGNKGGADAFIVKLDQDGNRVLSKTFGGPKDDALFSVATTKDGGFVAVGDTLSSSGDIPDNKGNCDGIIAKFDASGTKQWAQNVGGSDNDFFRSVVVADDGSFYIAGITASNGGDIPSGSRTAYDAILVKFTESSTSPSPTETSASPTPTQTIPNVTPGTTKFSKAPTPKISGVKKVGRKLTAKAGTWSPAAQLTYNWYRNGKAIAGAYKSTYTLTAKDLGKKITVKVTGYRNNYAKTPKKSAATVKIGLGELTRKPVPNISGTKKVGYTLKVNPGTWKPTVKKAYQWYRNGKKIKGATKSTYKLVKADAGKKITVKLTATKAGYKTVTKTSKPTKIASLPKPKPVSTPTPSPTYTEPCEFGTDKC